MPKSYRMIKMGEIVLSDISVGGYPRSDHVQHKFDAKTDSFALMITPDVTVRPTKLTKMGPTAESILDRFLTSLSGIKTVPEKFFGKKMPLHFFKVAIFIQIVMLAHLLG